MLRLDSRRVSRVLAGLFSLTLLAACGGGDVGGTTIPTNASLTNGYASLSPEKVAKASSTPPPTVAALPTNSTNGCTTTTWTQATKSGVYVTGATATVTNSKCSTVVYLYVCAVSSFSAAPPSCSGATSPVVLYPHGSLTDSFSYGSYPYFAVNECPTTPVIYKWPQEFNSVGPFSCVIA